MRGVRAMGVWLCLAACQVDDPYSVRGSAQKVDREGAPPKVEDPPEAKAGDRGAEVPPAPPPEKGPKPAAADEPSALPEGEAPKALRVEAKEDAVTVIDEGAEPHEALRYAPEVGDTQRVELRMKMKIGMTLADKQVDPTPMPEVIVVIENTVEKSGDRIRYGFIVKDARKVASEDTSDRVLRAVDKAVRNMKQTKGTLVVDTRGTRRDTQIEAPRLATPGLRPSLSGFQQSFGQLYPELPEVPVGVGAQWRAISHFELGGVPIQQESTYTLKRREGTQLQLELEFTQAAVGEIDTPDAVQMNVTSFGGHGEGEVTVDLSRVAPLQGTTKSRSLTESKLQFAGSRQDVTMDMALDLSLDGDG